MFETGFTNLQFVALSALAHDVGDRLFEAMLSSIQTDEARHAQIGGPVLARVVEHGQALRAVPGRQVVLAQLAAVRGVTGFAMDYLTPLAHRRRRSRSSCEEWILDQFILARSTASRGPGTGETFVEELDFAHHSLQLGLYAYPHHPVV